jgi:hypothetical protein
MNIPIAIAEISDELFTSECQLRLNQLSSRLLDVAQSGQLTTWCCAEFFTMHRSDLHRLFPMKSTIFRIISPKRQFNMNQAELSAKVVGIVFKMAGA